MRSVQGRTVLVTGAAMGLGRLFAEKAVADEAAQVVLWDINADAVQATAAELAEIGGGTVRAMVVDVSDQSAIAAAAAQVRDEVGPVHVLVNNAGIIRGNGYFWETANPKDIQLTMAINSLAPMLISMEFLPGMIAAGGDCRIVNIASSAGLVSNPRMSVYAASKWAAVGWSDSIRLELEQAGHDHVRVTTVCPTYINTGMFAGAQGILLTPILEQQDVVDSTWKEMLKGGPFLIIPWTSRLNKVLTGILPVKLRDFYLDRVGVYHSMEDFTGHADDGK